MKYGTTHICRQLRSFASLRSIPYLFNQRRTGSVEPIQENRLNIPAILHFPSLYSSKICGASENSDRKRFAATDISIRANKSRNHVCHHRGSVIKYTTRATTQGREGYGPFTPSVIYEKCSSFCDPSVSQIDCAVITND